MSSVARAINSLDKKNSRRGTASINDSVNNESEFNSEVDWSDNDGVEISSPYTWDEVSAEMNTLTAADAANAYKQKREDSYPDIGDQLDALYHAGVFPDDMSATLKAVKDANPKD
jgi:hypothetical protein